ncbi:thioesterase family protein [Aerococcaceae bacterium DSM 111176]|nr:thioesterase family protein [Aerococcaceae bacterium DSM 111176]
MKEITVDFVVQSEHSARSVGSGSLDVLSTPMLIAYMEETAAGAIEESLPEGQTSVGISIEAKHLKASAIGSTVSVTATVNELTDKKAVYSIVASQNDLVIGTAEHTRAIVQVDRFMEGVLE